MTMHQTRQKVTNSRPPAKKNTARTIPAVPSRTAPNTLDSRRRLNNLRYIARYTIHPLVFPSPFPKALSAMPDTPTQTGQPLRAAALPDGARIVAFCQTPGSPLDRHLALLIGRGLHVSAVPLRHLPLDWFDRYATSYDLALVDADFLGDKFAMIDFGMRLRRFCPGLPVIMLSSRIAASDRSTERMAFCDVTLRSPATDGDLVDALAIAMDNHAYWRDTATRT